MECRSTSRPIPDLYFMVPLLGTLLWPDAKFLVESVNLDHKTTLLAFLNF